MANALNSLTQSLLRDLPPDRPVLIAGPTASGKSALALALAEAQGGVIVNADASQVYDCWRVVTARPSPAEERRAPHRLYGHVAAATPYSAGHWLREVIPLLSGGARPIIVGGTGLYFRALTQGLAEIPATPPALRAHADTLSLAALRDGLDERTAARIDLANRARVQRAWEVLAATGRGLADWQADTGQPALARAAAHALVMQADTDWLNARIARRFDDMLAQGALEEAEKIRASHDPSLPAHRAIGVPELMGYLDGLLTLDEARDAAVIATRQFAKRQRTWFRSNMRDWQAVTLPA